MQLIIMTMKTLSSHGLINCSINLHPVYKGRATLGGNHRGDEPDQPPVHPNKTR